MIDTLDERLQAYLDGELDAQAARALEAELDRDPALAARLADLRALYAKLEGLEDEALARDLRPGVLAALDAQAARAWPAWLLPAQAGLAALLLALATTYLGGRLPGLPDVAAGLQSTLAQLVTGAQSLLAQTSQSLAAIARLDPGRLVALPSVGLSTTTLLALAASLLLLGLVGNGLLLRGNQRT